MRQTVFPFNLVGVGQAKCAVNDNTWQFVNRDAEEQHCMSALWPLMLQLRQCYDAYTLQLSV